MMAKPLDKLSAREIEALDAKLWARVSANCHALIDAGFGKMRSNEIDRAACEPDANPLFIEHHEAGAAWQLVVTEIRARERWHGSHRPIKRASVLY